MPRVAREIPWVEPNGDGVYYAHWYDTEAKRTRRLSLKTSNPEVAQPLFAEFLAEKNAIEGRPAPRTMTVAETLQFYYDEHVANKVVAVARQEYAAAALNRHLADKAISSIDTPECRKYRALRAAEGVADATIRRELSTLRAAARIALQHHRIDADAMPQFELPPDAAPRPDKWLTKEQFTELHRVAEGRAKRFIWLDYWTAGRKQVVYSLKWSQVDFERGHIDLHPAGRKRTKKRNPVIHIPSALRPELEAWHREALLAAAEGAVGLAAFSPDISDKYVLGMNTEPKRGFEAAAKAAKLEHLGVSPHWLRHSRASHMLLDGVPLYKVARFLGDTAATVDRVYGHITPSDMEGV